MDSSLVVQFVDGLTGQPITDALQVELKDQGNARRPNGQPLGVGPWIVTTGEFAFLPDFSGTEALRLIVGNNATGYLPTAVRFTAQAARGNLEPQKIKLFKTDTASLDQLNNSSLGIAGASTRVDTVGGALPAVALSTPSKQITPDLNREGVDAAAKAPEALGSARIAFQQGTQALDSKGQPIALTGSIALSALYYGSQQAASLQSFPGGFATPVQGTLPAGSASNGQGIFITGGFASFHLVDANGTALKRFDRPLSIQMDLRRSSINPVTRAKFKAGDEFPVYSFDEQTGQWTYETQGQVVEKSTPDRDFLEVRFTTQHLSYWNLDHYPPSCTITLSLPTNRETLKFFIYGRSEVPFFIPEHLSLSGNQPTDPQLVDLNIPNVWGNPYNYFDLTSGAGNTSSIYSMAVHITPTTRPDTVLAVVPIGGQCGQQVPVNNVATTQHTVEFKDACTNSTSNLSAAYLTVYGQYQGVGSLSTPLQRIKLNGWNKQADGTRSLKFTANLPTGALLQRLELLEVYAASGGQPERSVVAFNQSLAPAEQSQTRYTYTLNRPPTECNPKVSF